MISPKDVEQKSRKLATLAFVILVLAFFAAAGLTIYEAVKQRNSPPTQMKLVKQKIKLPVFQLCPASGITIQYTGSTECFHSSPPPGSEALKAPNGEWPEKNCDYQIVDFGTYKCLEFNLAQNITLVQKTDWMYISLRFNASFTVPQDQLTGQLFEVIVYNDKDGNAEIIPYNLPFPSLSVMYLQETRFKSLSGSETVEHSLRISSTSNVQGSTAGSPYFLDAQIRRENLRVTIIEEQDPLNVTILIGVISGFWGYCTLIYSFLFVPVEKDKTTYRYCCGRDESRLAKTVEIVGRDVNEENYRVDDENPNRKESTTG